MRALKRGELEPAVEGLILGLADDPKANAADMQIAILTSLAISTKRIADALESVRGELSNAGGFFIDARDGGAS